MPNLKILRYPSSDHFFKNRIICDFLLYTVFIQGAILFDAESFMNEMFSRLNFLYLSC